MSPTGILTPTGNENRISSLDIIRGVSLCGILLMNITGFGLPHAYLDPTVSGGATGHNLTVWWTNSMFFEGTMRGMFTILFGAGIILFTGRSTGSINGVSVTDAYFRRILWLLLFGIIHCYLLLWDGEILYTYAIVAMFAFSFRHWKPGQLVIGCLVLLFFASAWNFKDYMHEKNTFELATAAKQKKDKGNALTKKEESAIMDWQSIYHEKKPSQEKLNSEIEAFHQDYFSIVVHKGPTNQYMQTTFFYRIAFFETFALMLLGMALLKNGILKAEKSNRYYMLLAVVGYSVGLAVNYWETSYVIDRQFDIIAMDLTDITYHVGRVSTTLAHIAMIMLFIKSEILIFLQRALGAVGQMAFTNYIMQTLICNTIFLGFGFSLYGMLERHELYYVVVSVWIFQLIVSPIWLHYFRFGPLEWVWRSLTYWQRQPFKRENTRTTIQMARSGVQA
ncbi:MAG TPA: DUF418 domain-containing protein [Chryseolinea sp.]|nr:DUF418 domain-containing protein [Chryseolinea sp.]